MFPVAPFVVNFALLEFAIIGLIIGAVSGVLVSIILKLAVQGIVKDAFLGAAGFLMMWFLVIVISRRHDPFVAAAIFSVVLPALHQFYRFKHLGSAVKSTR